MDLKGFEKINATLDEAKVAATVTPEPENGQSVDFVTIETATDVPPCIVLEVLNCAGLLHPVDVPGPYGPRLEPMFGQPGSLTFRDQSGPDLGW